MTGQDLLTVLHQQGFSLTPLPGNRLAVRPASKLTPPLREALKKRTGELLALLKGTEHSPLPRAEARQTRQKPLLSVSSGGPGRGPGKIDPSTESAAVTWLRSKLTPSPRHIADCIAEWCGGQEVRHRDGTLRWEGGRDGTNGRQIDDLMAARWRLRVEAFIGPDYRFMWRLPLQDRVQ